MCVCVSMFYDVSTWSSSVACSIMKKHMSVITSLLDSNVLSSSDPQSLWSLFHVLQEQSLHKSSKGGSSSLPGHSPHPASLQPRLQLPSAARPHFLGLFFCPSILALCPLLSLQPSTEHGTQDMIENPAWAGHEVGLLRDTVLWGAERDSQRRSLNWAVTQKPTGWRQKSADVRHRGIKQMFRSVELGCEATGEKGRGWGRRYLREIGLYGRE